MDIAIGLILSFMDVVISISVLAAPFIMAVLLISIPIRKLSNKFTEHCFRHDRVDNDEIKK